MMNRPMRPSTRIATLALCGALSFWIAGCAVGPNHKAPEVKAPEAHRASPKDDKKPFQDLPWWKVYRDPGLVSLLKEATEKSFDLRVALARVEAYREAHRAAVWALAPTLGVRGGLGDAVGSPTVPGIYPPVEMGGNYGFGVGASWEPDVWGRLRRLSDVALHSYEAADEDRRGVYVALVGDVAELYFYLGALDLQKEAADKAVIARRETYELFRQRSAGGVGNDLEVARARAALAQAEAAFAQIDQLERTTENSLSFLLARLPGPIDRTSARAALDAPPSVPAGLPSTLLKRRPDVRAAEKRLLAANAQIGAEMADFFPKFELTAFLGLMSPDLSEAQSIRGGAGLFSWTLPFLGGESVRAEHRAAKANFRASAALYERTAYQAFREVADALVAVQALAARRKALDEQLAALEMGETLAMDRYRGGVANYLEVLTVQEQVFLAALEASDVKGKQLGAVARLYRVLGGGWPLDEDGHTVKEEEKKEEKTAKAAK